MKPHDKLDFFIQGGYSSYLVNEWDEFTYNEILGEQNYTWSFGVGLDYYVKKNLSLRVKSIISEREFTGDQIFLNHSILANYYIGNTFKFKIHSGLVYSHAANFEENDSNDFGFNLASGFEYKLNGKKVFFEFETITFFRNVTPLLNEQGRLFAKLMSLNLGFGF